MEKARKHIGEQSGTVMYLRQLEHEKLKLSRELHDTALQEQIIALREMDLILMEPEFQQKLELKSRLMRVREQQANSVYILRNFCQTHYVPRLGDGELRHHIQFLLDHLQIRTNIDVVYDYLWRDNPEGERALHTYRIIQELLHNTEKHANATKVELLMEQKEEYFHIDYRDDGVGCDGTDNPSMGKLGLKGIYSRAEFLQAEVKIISSKQAGGYQCSIQFPLKGA